ncbi:MULTISPECIES: ATP-dependent protease ATPase subunit HslU [unclassified Arcicella]|uniref:ATP-dependent protease ATPase subunit HslU n=1 Tax=unclassified Arcicella TaxID=2644986 RepID=UPI002855A818|nr:MULTISPECIES: ATP-dependent protease ATPase subunit HslU [unclassified Arcicella]MDR6562889.1 ATP-dependent HslUV protease ATP-binding subunit HslU [Arcicella sp. BE51]MDR6812770.1 ATP-dependent HslUV protease ATP-binding subunit HslU [Arcicella sp. BE140]MDR6824082.1 ATP-dependent HslUV protease ATP-binding subunit HslU [Arcicella sp. BE139]
MANLESLTPKQIVAELDKYIIGQKDAKKNVAIALRNRWRRMNAPIEMQKEITPNNILMIGSTGVGKTEIARRLAKLADAPFTKVEASKFTEVGYVGRDVESMVRDLVESSIHLVQSAKKEEVKDKASEIVEEIIVEALVPSMGKTGKKKKQEKVGFDSNEVPESDEELNQRTRELFREKLRRGELENRKIDIAVRSVNTPNIGVMGGPIDEMSMMNISEMIGGMLPKKEKKRKMTIADARKVLLEEESAKLIDMDEVKEEAIRKAENLGIIFIDEIDKIASSRSGGGGPDVSREGVQRDMLPIVEGSTVNTKYGVINTDHVLFIAAGAFHVSKPSDLIPELQGRFPIRVELQSLKEEDFYRILKEPKSALTKQYISLLQSEGVELSFDDEALAEIARIAFAVNSEVENIGARRLQTVMSHLLNDIMFDIPDVIVPNEKIVIGKELVLERLGGMVKNRDLSQYIL